ncbi:MAG TPA: selenide, water dikinase SelD, partial [Chroococcidiopsis sp.]
MKSALPIVKDLVLIGGGHSHAIALKLFGMNPLPGVRITLISDVDNTPYSGMLPGYIAGLYSFDDCHIDLRPLCQFAGVVMVRDRAIGLDLEQRRVLCAEHPPIAFDLLSIDTGSTPATSTVPGAADYAVPVKPISQFLQYWDRWMVAIAQQPDQPIRLAVVGGGAGGVELTLAAQARLSKVLASHSQPSRSLSNQLSLHLLHRGDRLIPERARWVGQRLQTILQQQGVTVHLGETVARLEPVPVDTPTGAGGKAALGTTRLICQSGYTLDCDRVFWVTQASAAPWLAASGLAADPQGFVLVSDTLQSVSHPNVFATGDVATMVNHPRPKAGVFSVRQGRPLYDNLRRVLLAETPQPFLPQREFLILVGTGDRTALASRGQLGFGPYPWLWRWKERIDRQFMERFRHLTPMVGNQAGSIVIPSSDLGRSPASTVSSTPPMRCAGCGSKVGSRVLEQVLRRVQQESGGLERDDIEIGLAAADDAAAISVPPGQVLLQTVDYFRALVDDPFVFGQIAAHHCLSDLFAMGASPQSALAIATLPDAAPPQLEATLYQLLSGAVQVLTQAGAVLIGGHTTVGDELAFGLTCNGLAAPQTLWRKGGMQPDDQLILTKPLGTGTLFAANMQLRAKGRWISSAIESMQVSNQGAVACLRRHQATACTDITGFGLVGHLLEMVRASGVGVELAIADLPVLTGAADTLAQGFFSSLHDQNLAAEQAIANRDAIARHPLYPLLFDPQTAGGLLASVPHEQAI